MERPLESVTISKKDAEVLMHFVHGKLYKEAEGKEGYRYGGKTLHDMQQEAMRKVDPAAYDALQNLMRVTWK